MTLIRSLHQLAATVRDDADLAKYTRRIRKTTGCVEAEAYRSIEDSGRVSIVELWCDQYAYGSHWENVLASPEPDVILSHASAVPQGESSSEFYRHEYFFRDRIWVAAAHRDRAHRIQWPGRGAVRIIAQTSPADTDGALPALRANAKETNREPGCLQFEWFRSVEYPNHMLLLELWRDQAIYDAHWHLRIKSGAGGGAASAPRTQGSNGLEFYRQQRFVHLYDRWVPLDVTSWSETVLWPD